MIVNNRGERPSSIRLVQHPMKCKLTASPSEGADGHDGTDEYRRKKSCASMRGKTRCLRRVMGQA